MKLYWKDGDENPFEKTPFAKGRKFMVEPTEDAFWCYSKGQRDAGSLPETPINEILKWILEQIALGHMEGLKDENGDVVSLTIGKEVPLKFDSPDQAAENASIGFFGLQVAGLIAEAREKGSHPKTIKLEKSVWEKSTANARRRIELHYAGVLAQLLGRISKKLQKLELLPILEKAPKNTRTYIAEATRCYLLKMDRACIALCRACIEHSLNDILTDSMKKELADEMGKNKRRVPLAALIDVCIRHGKLEGCVNEVYEVREQGNRILHLQDNRSGNNSDIAWSVLEKTRKIVGLIYGAKQESD